MRVLDKIVDFVDLVQTRIGQAASLLVLLMIALIVGTVIMRLARLPLTWQYDVAIMGTGAMFALCAAYTMIERRDIQVDVFWEKYSPRVRNIMWIAGILFLMWPLFGFALWFMTPWAWDAFVRGEVSPFGLRIPGWPFKWVLTFGVLMLLVQSLSYLYRYGKALAALLRSGGDQAQGGESTRGGGQ